MTIRIMNISINGSGVLSTEGLLTMQLNVLRKSYGYFESEVEAALEYNRIASALFGQFARMNVKY